MGQEQLERFLPHVYRYAVYMLRDHHLAEDVTQETMLRAIKHETSIRSPQAWLLKVAANVCRDHVRSKRNAVRSAGSMLGEPAGTAPEPWFGLLQRESCQALEETIARLTGREQSVLYLSAFEGLSNPEIAEVLEVTTGAVKVALSRARKSVRSAILSQRKQENQV